MSTLVRAIMGDFNYDELSAVRPHAAPLFSAFYVAVMVFVVLCVFIAILTKYYEVVSSEMQKENNLIQKELLDVFEFLRDFRLMITSFLRLRDTSKNIISLSLSFFRCHFVLLLANCLFTMCFVRRF